MHSLLRYKIPRLIGLDRAIAFTVLGRVLQALGSVVNVLLILHYLSPTEQGYYYVLWSVVALQAVFELGFSFVVLQMAAHERVHLQFHADGSITGSSLAHYRLASLLQRTVRWYLGGALVMGFALMIGAAHFFELRQPLGEPEWRGPVQMTVIACMAVFVLNPILSFIEGCGQVTPVARVRLYQSVASALAAWTSMISHHGLYAPAMVLFGQAAVAIGLVWSRRLLLVRLMRRNTSGQGISWGSEVWPFQWKIAVSWLCDYFIFQLFTPAIFAFRGPAEAGRMGLSLNIVTQMSAMMLVWMTTKSAQFGSLIAKKDIAGLDSLFFRSLKQSVLLLTTGAIVVLVGVLSVPFVLPQIMHRVVSWPVFLLLLLTAIGSHVVQSEAIYLRAHKCEPFLVQSIVIAAVTAASVLVFAKTSGTLGVAIASFIVLGVFGTLSATSIFRWRRKAWGYSG